MSREQLLAEVTKKYEDIYRRRTKKSSETMEKARRFMPGGDTRTSIWFDPYPFWIDKAEGCRFTDVDGNEYIDFHNCYTTMILGHANPKVVAAVREQASKGTAFGALIPTVVRWSELVCNMVDSVDKVRFGNSGTEAVMMAIRLARGLTGKDLLLKTDGCYHLGIGMPQNHRGVAVMEINVLIAVNIVLFPMTESREGVSNLHQILSLEGVTGTIVGTNDLVLDIYGTPPKMLRSETVSSEIVEDKLREIARICKKAGKVAGIGGFAPKGLSKWAKEGYQLFMLGYVINNNYEKLKPAIDEMKSLLGL